MKTKTLSLIAAAALGIGIATAVPAGNQAQAADFRIDIRVGDGRHADGYYGDYRHGRRYHRGHRYGRRVHPRAVRYRLRHRGYYRINRIRFHRRPIRVRGGRHVRGFYTAHASHHGRRYVVYLNRRGHAFMRRPIRRY